MPEKVSLPSEDVVRGIRGGGYVVVSHEVADLDGVGAALALALLFPDVNLSISAPSKIAKGLADHVGVSLSHSPYELEGRRTVVVDTPSPILLPDDVRLFNPVVIDHHQTKGWEEYEGDDKAAPLFWVDPGASSTCELILRFLLSENIDFGRDVGFVLSAGILADTANFRHSSDEVFFITAEMMREKGVSIKEVYDILSSPDTISLRVARLKGCQRIVFRTEKNIIVAGTVLRSFEAEMARHLIRSGADVSFVVSQRKNEIRVSARSSRAVQDLFHLGEFLESEAEILGMEGGGHSGAGGMNGTGDAEAVLNILLKDCISALKGALRR